ncbi:MAG: hypothetical protein ACLR8P_14775 [Clostridium fessum]
MLNPANSQYYEGIIGGKTGYTSLAGNTLVTCAERNGVRLIAVILKSSQTHYDDTKKLLDYAFCGGGKRIRHTGWHEHLGIGCGEQQYVSSASRPAIRPAKIPLLPAVRAGPGSSGSGNTVAQGDGAWQQFEARWKYLKANGTYAANESLLIKGRHTISMQMRGWRVTGRW